MGENPPNPSKQNDDWGLAPTKPPTFAKGQRGMRKPFHAPCSERVFFGSRQAEKRHKTPRPSVAIYTFFGVDGLGKCVSRMRNAEACITPKT